jgi:hypothetical protein
VELLSNNLRQHVLRYFEQDKQQLTEFDNWMTHIVESHPQGKN